MLAKCITVLWALLLLVSTAQAQFQFFEQMFGGGGHGGHHGEQEAPSDSSWYQRTWEGGDLLSPIAFYRSVHEQNPQRKAPSNIENISSALRDIRPENNNLLSPVHIPEDPNAVLKEKHPAAKLLAHSSLVIHRDIDAINVVAGFEQANRYVIMDANGNHVGYMAEQDNGHSSAMSRIYARSNRSFTMYVFDRDQKEVLRFQRPSSWLNSRIRVYDPLEIADPAYSPSNTYQPTPPTAWASIAGNSKVAVSPLSISDMRVIGEAQLKWALFRRKYNLFLFQPNLTSKSNLGTKHIPATGGKLSPTQQMQLRHNRVEPTMEDSSVNRNFAGFTEEFLTGTGGVYALRMDAAVLAEEKERQHTHTNSTIGMTLDQRAVMLAGAVGMDFDFFSRAIPNNPWFWAPVDAGMIASQSATAGASTGAAEAAAGSAASSIGRVGAIGTLTEGVTAAGTVAGYEAMRQGMNDNHSPSPYPSPSTPDTPAQSQSQGSEEVWGEAFPQVPPQAPSQTPSQAPSQASPGISENEPLGKFGPGGGATGSNIPGSKGGGSLNDILDFFL
ncbi:Phospholipid scramblase family protein C343,06c [Talaromyces islandicus]|uniref:Phospholipid scramblase family protein C343,06c n=1 Tax=Talaromyces islandicus TaxID=28573 RepID=A0A0U1LV38_TALIS|nr:Phospholipid scramblase family protein C343,06c [Talaromyces islandicus]